MTDYYTVDCPDCGYSETVTEGAFGADIETRAKRKKAGHMSGNGCSNTTVTPASDENRTEN
jgi:hypothetical protein